MWSHFLFASILLVFSAVLIRSHLQAARYAGSAKLSPEERTFLAKQTRRRMTASSLIGVLGIAILAGYWVGTSSAAAVYWLVVLAVTLLITLFAPLDLVRSRAFLATQTAEFVEQHADLFSEAHPYDD